MVYTAKDISHTTGLKPVLTFDQLVAKYESLEPKLPDNPSKASLTLNSMAVQQFLGIAMDNNDRERDLKLLKDRQDMIKEVAAYHGFTPHDVQNAMGVLDPDLDDVPMAQHFRMDTDDEDDDDSNHPPYARGPGYGPVRRGMNAQTVRGAEFNWMGQPQPFGRHGHPVNAPPPGHGRGPPPPPPQGIAQPQVVIDPRLIEHLTLQGQNLARTNQPLEALGKKEFRAQHPLP